MNSNRITLFAGLAAILLFGWAVKPLERRIRDADHDAVRLENLSENLGQGISLAALGGYRSLAANMVWLTINPAWERRDLSTVLGKIRLAVNLDPRPLIFWQNGSRIIANDLPSWQPGGASPEAKERFAAKALEFLDGALDARGPDWAISVEKGLVHWRKRGDLESAAAEFAIAVEMPGAPYHVSRVYAELLILLGRESEALDFLRAHYRTLPDNDLTALKPVVARRIQDLEKRLE